MLGCSRLDKVRLFVERILGLRRPALGLLPRRACSRVGKVAER